MKNLKIGPKLILCFMLVTCLSSISGILGAFFLHWSDPVSYTHLDVYKRQVIRRCYYGGEAGRG